MSRLDAATRQLLIVAAALNDEPEGRVVELMREARALGTSAAWLEELVLEAPLFVGYPRALVAAVALRAVEPKPGPVGDAADYERWPDWQERGEATGRRIYGKTYDKLMKNLAQLHPVLEAWIVRDGYGRSISRPALDLQHRELCAIALLVAQNAPRQLHAHLRGALNVGNAPWAVEETLAIVAPLAPAPRAAAARALWDAIKVGAGVHRSSHG